MCDKICSHLSILSLIFQEADYAAALGLLDAQAYEVRKTAHGGNAGHEWCTTMYSSNGTFLRELVSFTASPPHADYDLSISSVTTTAKEEFELYYGESKSTPVPVGASAVEMQLLLQDLTGFDDISVGLSVATTGFRSDTYTWDVTFFAHGLSTFGYEALSVKDADWLGPDNIATVEVLSVVSPALGGHFTFLFAQSNGLTSV
jgi:hypothetical protein